MHHYAELAGRVALVTGAARGIGFGIAKAFARQGCVVAINDCSREACESAVKEIEHAGGVAICAAADVGDPVAVSEVVDRVTSTVRPIDILVNNAGINPTHRLIDMPQDTWEVTQRVNLWGLLHWARPIGAQMAERGAGSIVVIASPAAEETYVDQANYAASKAGLKMLARSYAWELGEYGVRTNIVHPGWIETELNREWLAEGSERRSQVVGVIPARRTGTPEDVARAVVWLCTDDAAYVNGATLTVDGGLLAGRPKV